MKATIVVCRGGVVDRSRDGLGLATVDEVPTSAGDADLAEALAPFGGSAHGGVYAVEQRVHPREQEVNEFVAYGRLGGFVVTDSEVVADGRQSTHLGFEQLC